MPRVPARSLVDIELSEEAFRADFELTAHYQAFSGELVRLALLGIAGYGFLVAEQSATDRSMIFDRYSWVLGIGVICLGLSTAAALAHRFFSTDCLSHQITILRLLKRSESPSWTEKERKVDVERLSREREEQRKDLKRCRWLLVLSAALLFFGAIAVALIFAAAFLGRA